MTKEDKYKAALQIAHNEGKILWDSSQIFLLTNTILGTFIGQSASKAINKNLAVFLPSLMGFMITFIWLTSHLRRSSYHKFRMAQLRELESEIGGINLISGDGYIFSQGAGVEIKNKEYRLPLLARCLDTHTIILLIIILFLLGYTALTILSRPF